MFSLDPRGGHNRYTFNKDFFKKWTPEMAYVLGFLYADGNITDSKISRTQYVSFDSVDKEILEKIRIVLSSNHKIQVKPAKILTHFNGNYKSSIGYRLRIGSREMFADLINLGVTPRKSLTITFPKDILVDYTNHFIRGYFDGDGCVHIIRGNGKYGQRILKGLKVIFTSGSKIFLQELQKKLKGIGIENGRIYFSSRAYSLKYPTTESVKLFKFLYNNSSFYLKRKFDTFIEYFRLRPSRFNSIITLGHVAK